MKTILVDDEYWALESFEEECSEEDEVEIVGKFMSAEDALAFAKDNLVEFALIDIQLSGMNGVDLAKKLREIYPEVIIVFVTAHKEYLADFIDMKADYYVLKPYTKQDFMDVFERAKLLSGRFRKKVRIRCFGEFDVFVNGEILAFTSSRAKELLALIVDKKGGVLGSREAFAKMWEGVPYNNQSSSSYRKVLHRLCRFLDEKGIGDILLESNHGRALNINKVDCDLIDFYRGDKNAIETFGGRYMAPYSWGEETLGELYRISGKDSDM